MVFKEHIYAWYPQVDVPEYTAAKPGSYEIERLYREASKHYLEKPPTNNVPTIGFRISRKTAQEEEEGLSPVEFLRRCKSAPLHRKPCGEVSPRHLTGNDFKPKPETKSFLAVPATEDPTNEVSITEFPPRLQSPRQNSLVGSFSPKTPPKVRPSSASLVTEKKFDAEQCARKHSSARTNRQVKVHRPCVSPMIVVTPPGDGNSDAPKSSLLKTPPKLSPSVPVPQGIRNSNNGVFGPRNSAGSYTYRPRITSADSRARERVNRQNSNNKENTNNCSYSWKPPESSNQSTSPRAYKISDANNLSGQNGGKVQNENRDVSPDGSVTGKNVSGLGKKSKGDYSKINVQIEVPRPPEANSVKPEVCSSKRACATKTNVRELAIKEIRQYDSDDYEKELRTNGWRMEVQGNKFGLKKTPVRLPYWVPLPVPKVPDAPPVFRTKASSTFFYNTIPSRPKRMTISQNWHSEISYEQRLANINRKRRGYHYRNWSFVY